MEHTLALPLLVALIALALAFDFLNGLHDAANSIATVVSTRLLGPVTAVLFAAAGNFAAYWLVGLHVAETVGKGIIDKDVVTPAVVFGALVGAMFWNVLTWIKGIPSSSSHALIGGLCGATLASAHGNWSVIHWIAHNPTSGKLEGLWPKVVAPMFTSPALGILVGFLFMTAGSIALFLGSALLGWTLVWIVVALAALNAFGGFCVGCAMYYWLVQLKVPGFVKQPPANTFPGMKPKAGAAA